MKSPKEYLMIEMIVIGSSFFRQVIIQHTFYTAISNKNENIHSSFTSERQKQKAIILLSYRRKLGHALDCFKAARGNL